MTSPLDLDARDALGPHGRGASGIVDRPALGVAGTLVALVSAARPKQWLKNLLVVAAPLSAGVLLRPSVAAATAVAVVAFCLSASATYLLNDVVDVAADRAHPHKRHRPIASGRLGERTATAAAALLALTGTTLAFLVRPALGAVVVAYLAITMAYSLRLKHQPVLELMLLASGFLLRAIAGGAATGVPLSAWFLVVTGFGSLFMAAGKRASELQRVAGTTDGRPALVGYTASYLRFVWQLSAGVTVTAYCLWAFQVQSARAPAPLLLWSIVPLLLAMLSYAADIDRGSAEAPEDAVLGDRLLLAAAAAWAVLFALGALQV